jgi:hypothetical protein
VLTMKFPCLQELPPTEPMDQGDEGELDTWGKPLGVAAQPSLSKNFWRRWSASPPLLRRAWNPPLLLRKRQWV